MEAMNLSRSYLETLSSADLVQLADECGIDIPDDLNRRFIIEELLEASQEEAVRAHSEMQEGAAPEDGGDFLPLSYNETEIDVVLRLPAWAYVWWDISDAAFKKATADADFRNFVLRLSYFDAEQSNAPTESFDIHVSLEDREKFVLLSADKKYFRIDLVALFRTKESDNLAVSKKMRIPAENRIALSAVPGRELDVCEIDRLSGMERLLRSHYNNYRQSFAE